MAGLKYIPCKEEYKRFMAYTFYIAFRLGRTSGKEVENSQGPFMANKSI